MKPWVKDMDDTIAANLLTIYQNELNGTYIAYTGNGTSGDPSSFLNANTNYARIDGPSVWIEFICQNGVVFRNQIHYHTIWRDHVRDYDADLSLTTPLDNTGATTTKTRFDFDGGGKVDVSVFRLSNGTWYLSQSTSGFTGAQFGTSTDKIVPADYDGDGKTDFAVVRRANGLMYWYIFNSSTSAFNGTQFGLGSDTVVPGDYDGDGKTDAAVVRKNTSGLSWYVLRSSDGKLQAANFGATETDLPVQNDYDGDGKTNIAVWRESDGTFYILNSTDNSVPSKQWGFTSDVPLAAYDSH